MITLGIDLSSMPEGTAACRITWLKNRAIVDEPRERCTDDGIDDLILGSDVIGIDAPFGWPADFVSSVADWTSKSWNLDIRDRLRFRETDRFVREKTSLTPLSVSADRIALPAMRAMALLLRHGVTDRSGDGRFFEVYPAGSLACWGITCKGYKLKSDECVTLRKEIFNSLCSKFNLRDLPIRYEESPDALDALVASVTARAAKLGLTKKPQPEQLEAAKREGWIHLPTES